MAIDLKSIKPLHEQPDTTHITRLRLWGTSGKAEVSVSNVACEQPIQCYFVSNEYDEEAQDYYSHMISVSPNEARALAKILLDTANQADALGAYKVA